MSLTGSRMNVPGGTDIELDLVADAKDKRAGVLHAPLHVGQDSMQIGRRIG